MIHWQQEDRSTWRAFVDTLLIHLYKDGSLWGVYTSRNRMPVMFEADTVERAQRKALKAVLEDLRVERNMLLALTDLIVIGLE
jgi:hypothetical protein